MRYNTTKAFLIVISFKLSAVSLGATGFELRGLVFNAFKYVGVVFIGASTLVDMVWFLTHSILLTEDVGIVFSLGFVLLTT